MEKPWEQVRRESPLNEARVATYRRLSESEDRISERLSQRGVAWETIERALAASELTDEQATNEPDLYLTTLTRFVAALGGRLEIRAIFAEEPPIVVRRDPEDRERSRPTDR